MLLAAGGKVAGGGLGSRWVAWAYRDPGENTCRWVCLTTSMSAIPVAVEHEEVPGGCGRTGGAKRDDRRVTRKLACRADTADRLRVLRRALKVVTHPARHRDQVTAAIDWSRIDAAQMITMTAAFIIEMSAPDATPLRRTSATGESGALPPKRSKLRGRAPGHIGSVQEPPQMGSEKGGRLAAAARSPGTLNAAQQIAVSMGDDLIRELGTEIVR